MKSSIPVGLVCQRHAVHTAGGWRELLCTRPACVSFSSGVVAAKVQHIISSSGSTHGSVSGRLCLFAYLDYYCCTASLGSSFVKLLLPQGFKMFD